MRRNTLPSMFQASFMHDMRKMGISYQELDRCYIEHNLGQMMENNEKIPNNLEKSICSL
jgi:ubiquinone biosynthesis protein COQ9